MKKYVGYVVYVGYRLDAPGSYIPNSGVAAGPKASRAGSNSQFVPIPEEETGRDRDEDGFHFGKSRDSSALFQQEVNHPEMVIFIFLFCLLYSCLTPIYAIVT